MTEPLPDYIEGLKDAIGVISDARFGPHEPDTDLSFKAGVDHGYELAQKAIGQVVDEEIASGPQDEDALALLALVDDGMWDEWDDPEKMRDLLRRCAARLR